mmetsp:Transcript_24145/g.40472  ORF Transcript_24145/g.40472 Transcript_24145/m.40472 type:complete len:315 (+) Transcript_24145:69-1013(+)|eukprot:CAMPEP_0198227014 /NCGR_PEP_ID=MMETSP1445-20131203/107545_1 /TAXON_ID=36898 /ORGANISM="Pyramimonas sp., Strain CCMP2087" /LENGTH=314 /DNA_ID=CAMNT_0043906959 /DNA_START=65 /DNA_END=1009 /DNA_ORIENTATION=-
MKVLITGGSGYLGQFLICDLASKSHRVAFTYNSHAVANKAIPWAHVSAHRVDLQTGEGLEECVQSLGTVDVIINCAAISQPGVCEKNTELARSINVPSAILSSPALKAQQTQPLLIHISTDQVYEGVKSLNAEDDETNPVNAYGRTKLEAEVAIRANWTNHAILRSSIIFGTTPPLVPVPRTLFVQWMEGALTGPEEVSFFEDEWRNPIFVDDIIAVVNTLLVKDIDAVWPHRTFNMGGPHRLSRVDMAMQLAKVKQCSPDKIKAAPSASVNRGVASPPDISMDVNRITTELGITLTSFEDGLRTFIKPYSEEA